MSQLYSAVKCIGKRNERKTSEHLCIPEGTSKIETRSYQNCMIKLHAQPDAANVGGGGGQTWKGDSTRSDFSTLKFDLCVGR